MGQTSSQQKCVETQIETDERVPQKFNEDINRMIDSLAYQNTVIKDIHEMRKMRESIICKMNDDQDSYQTKNKPIDKLTNKMADVFLEDIE